MPGPIRNQDIRNLIPTDQVKPGDIVEVVNVSANPEAINHTQAMEVTVDRWGNFQGELQNIEKGDHLRVRTRSDNGNVSNWISLQAQNLDGEDTRNAKVQVDAVGLEAQANGNIQIVYLGDGFVSEPGAQLRMTNTRTGEHFQFTVAENGQLPPEAVLRGQAGDEISIAISDGTHNKDFAQVAGVVKVDGAPAPIDLPEPAVWAKKHLNADGTPSVKAERFTGPLFVDGVSSNDVKQGNLANCYFAGAMSAVAHTDPQAIENMVKQNADGTYTVTFKERDYRGRVQEKKVTVDGDLFVRSAGGSPLYGSSTGTTEHGKMEMWYPIVEKAYAALHDNSYDKVGNGGFAGKVMEAVLGTPSSYVAINDANKDRVYQQLAEAQEKGWPATASTYGKDSPEAERYAGERLYPWHVYTILGVEEADGKKYVNIRNPWGNTEPGYDGKDDGVFRLELDKFVHFYSGSYINKG